MDPARSERLDLGVFVQGDNSDLTIGFAKAKGVLTAVHRLSTHLHTADRPNAFGLNDPRQFRGPTTMSNTDVLDDEDRSARGES